MPVQSAPKGTPDDDAVAEIDAFLRNGGSVCVPALHAARAGQILYQALPDGSGLQGPVYQALRAFFRANALPVESPERKTACIFVDPDPDITRDAQRQRAMVIQEEIHVAIARLNSWTGIDFERYRTTVRRELADNDYCGVAGPDCLGKNVIRFAMGPHYPEAHRRFAPHLIVPVTTGQDAGLAQENDPEAVRQTYLAVFRRNYEMLTTMSYYEDVDPA
ncbi:MAG TPA: hypothetical protein PKV72_02365 [Candidatus Peribacteria bacterium]|nr:hypothetical protein [Candidatus Peribacteria bacterium]